MLSLVLDASYGKILIIEFCFQLGLNFGKKCVLSMAFLRRGTLEDYATEGSDRKDVFFYQVGSYIGTYFMFLTYYSIYVVNSFYHRLTMTTTFLDQFFLTWSLELYPP